MQADSGAHQLLHALLCKQFPTVRAAIREECAALVEKHAAMHATTPAIADFAAALASLLRAG